MKLGHRRQPQFDGALIEPHVAGGGILDAARPRRISSGNGQNDG
jgi:hypothetical protein